MKTATLSLRLKAVHEHLSMNDFTTPADDRAIQAAIDILEHAEAIREAINIATCGEQVYLDNSYSLAICEQQHYQPEVPTMAKLSKAEKTELYSELRQAIVALCECWDHLRDAEGILGTDIETSDISGVASNMNNPASHSDIADEDLAEVVKTARKRGTR